ncbi:MAG: hypothetical protein WB770_02450, partial [Acidimicrobiales bacterium]
SSTRSSADASGSACASAVEGGAGNTADLVQALTERDKAQGVVRASVVGTGAGCRMEAADSTGKPSESPRGSSLGTLRTVLVTGATRTASSPGSRHRD